KTQGCFEAEIEMKLLEQPIWTVEYETDYDYDEVEKDYECEYYVSVNEGDRIISSEIQKMDIGKLMAAYNAINVEVMFHDHKPQDISIAWDSKGQPVKRIYAQIYLEKRLLEEKELDKRKKNWIDWDVSNLNYDTLILCVEYEDDRVFKKEIWGKSVREQLNKDI
ncbi:MAG: hypothetical protein MJA31_11485, partial [Clostridia bacterium]|nr:hypothetical protein [Clostridia bacterium]